MKRLFGLALVLGACGGGDDRVEDFVGSWTYEAGAKSVVDCDDDRGDAMNDLVGGMFQLAAGTSSDLVDVDADATAECPVVQYDVDGSKASARGGQKCTQMDTQNNITQTIDFDRVTYTLDGTGTKLTLDAAATLALTGAITVNCTIVASGTAAKGAVRVAAPPQPLWLPALGVGE